MAIPRSEEIKDLAIKYSKQQLAQLAQRGEVDPTTAIMAGMMRDRIVQAEMIGKMPDTTVFQDTFTPQQDMASAAGGPPQDQLAQMRAPVEGQPQMAMMAEGGLASLDVPDSMVPDEYAGGGIIAFANGGNPRDKETIERILREAQRGQGPNVSRFTQPAPIESILRTLTDEQRQLYDATGQLPPGAQSMLGPLEAAADEDVAKDDYVPANLRGIDMQSILSQADSIASAFRPQTQTAVPSIQEASEQTSGLLAASGYDTGMFDKLRQDIDKQREGLKGDRSEAVNMRLIEAGLGIMSGTSANAFENIGKGATGALKGLSQDFKDLRKSERELQEAQQNLMIKQNDSALGKARITQSTIDKAQERVDKQTENYNRTKADFAKTMLSGEIQERLARSTYSTKMTDFDKQWALYSKDAKARGEPATLDGFRRALEGSRSVITPKEATRMAIDALKNSAMDLNTAEGRAEFERLKRYFMEQGGGAAAPSAGGTPPPLPSGFVEQ